MQLLNLSVAFAAALATAASAHKQAQHYHVRRYGYEEHSSLEAHPASNSTTATVDAIPSGTGYESAGSTAVDATLSSTSSKEMTTSTVYATETFTITDCPETVTECPADAVHVVTSVVAVSTTVCPVDELPKPTETASPSDLVTKVSNTTLTYTLGTGSSATVITTTIKKTLTETSVHTVYATKPKPSETAVDAVPTDAAPSEDDTTTTIKSTSTTTATVTVYHKPTSTDYSPVGSANEDEGDKAECVPVTVTVTEKETIYVTPTPEPEPTKESCNTCHEVVPKQSSTEVYYPSGSEAYPTFPGSTGFITKAKPTVTGTGSYSASYPSTTADAEVPEGPAEEDYGYGYRRW